MSRAPSPPPLPVPPIAPLSQAALSETSLSGPAVGACLLTLPTPGVFVAIVTGTLPSGAGTVVSTLTLGRTQDQWTAQPLGSLNTLLHVRVTSLLACCNEACEPEGYV
jgi:hypothetical protein